MVIGTAGTVGSVRPIRCPPSPGSAGNTTCGFHVDERTARRRSRSGTRAKILKGLRLADSIAIDPHKWLYSPLEAGCILTRHPSTLHDAFAFKPHYYQFDDNEGQEVRNYFEYGPQKSRGFRALKIWLAFQQAGATAIAG